MTTPSIEWSEFMRSLGDAVIAIGVFDGVHVGHQALLQATVAEAHFHGTIAVAVTFDRDPDQVVSPETAAPQLLSLADKVRFIGETGIDTILVIPFTPTVAAMQPDEFLQDVIAIALRPVALHVGRDFRFGARAAGDLGALEKFGAEHGFTVTGHDLVEVDGEPVTSTRIRRLVAAGDVVAARSLLGRPPRVVGTVRRGRGEGAKLGFPTANIVPEPYAALPADGVYAGRAVFPGDEMWASAISVGTPPTFPEARDYLEAHLIDFDGDLYDRELTLEFFERLRGQTPFASLDDLTAAIAADVDRALDIAGFDEDESDDAEQTDLAPEAAGASDPGAGSWNPNPFSAFVSRILGSGDDDGLDDEVMPDGTPVVHDPTALASAERIAASSDSASCDSCSSCGDSIRWVPLLTTIDNAALSSGAHGFMIAAPLSAAGIPFKWDPYAPEDRPSSLPGGGAVEQPFTLLVPEADLEVARQLTARVAPAVPAPSQATPLVEDPVLLSAAEDSARTHATDTDAEVDWDSWLPVLVDQPYDRQRLLGIEFSLRSVGIPVTWEPFSPAKATLLNQGFFKAPVFTLAVPAGRFEEAQDVIEASESPAE